MLTNIINITFLGVVMIPILILFLTLTKVLVETMRRSAIRKRNAVENLREQELYTKPMPLRRVK